MKTHFTLWVMAMAFGLGLPADGRSVLEPGPTAAAIDWPAFMRQHDMNFDKLPAGWTEAPHFGNAMVGSMLYQADDVIRLQIFRADVQDHRDDTWGWTAYSRPRLQLGHFSLQPVGKLLGCRWRQDLWNAELTGTIRTDRGEIRIRHFTHAVDMAVVTELAPSAGEQGCRWSWHPTEARTTRGGYPTKTLDIAAFAKQYGSQYAGTLEVYQANPAGRLEGDGGVSVWLQDLLVGGQYATAWHEQVRGDTRTLIVSIANSYPESTAARTALSDVQRCLALDRSDWVRVHRDWWHAYYPRSFVSLPDKGLESLYWQTIYRFGCTTRTGRGFVDTPGLWFQGKSWPYFTADWNLQSAHWAVYAANRLEQGQALVDRLHDRREELIKAVRPVEWQGDSAYLPIAVAGDLIGNREGDMRYYHLVGNLPWVLNNCWSQYRYSMDDALLRDQIYPLLRRAINLYLHLVQEGTDGKLHLPPTYSPETGVWEDCNFDLALFKWGCHTLLKASQRLKIDDPLIPRWKTVIERLPDYPADEHGFMLGRDKPSSANHQHFSNLLMIYPLHLVNLDQEGTAGVMRRSFDRARSTAGPGQRQAMVQAHAGPIGTALGLGDEALDSLKRLQGDLYPNGLWYESPCIESTLAAANIIQDMLLQSWSDPAKEEPGPIRIFPALPSAWKDVEFRELRAEGAFLVSAKRTAGKTDWVRIQSLAGEPCRVRPGMAGVIRIRGERDHQFQQVSAGTYEIDLRKGEEVLLYQDSSEDGKTQAPTAKKSLREMQEEFRKLQFGMFIHYNMATFKGVQWVSGYHSPADFNPGAKIDTDAWADAAVSAGMKYGVLTAKHVGGFCLWDSKYTTYNVMNPACPYQQDLVAQFIKSFKSRGLKVGLYYCWRHPGFAAQYKVLPPECDPAQHSLAEQIEFQKKQIAELIEKYPDVFYIWNDGLDPDIMTAEEANGFLRGFARDLLASSNWWDWSKKGTPFIDIAVKEMRPFPDGNQAPGETCWCLEQGWFWKEGARPKIASQVVELLTTANSRNSNFLLKVGPDKQGKFDKSSVKVLAEIGKLLAGKEK